MQFLCLLFQLRAEIGMRDADQLCCALADGFAVQVGDAVLGGDDLHGMLAVIDVRDERNDGADLAALGR